MPYSFYFFYYYILIENNKNNKMALYPAPRVYEEIFNLENFYALQTFQTFFGYAKLATSNIFQGFTTFASDVIIATRLTVTDLNIMNTFLGYNVNIFSGIKAPIQAQIDSVIAGGIIQSTVSVSDTKTLDAGSAASVKNLGTSISANLEFSIPRGPVGATGDVGGTGSIGPTGYTSALSSPPVSIIPSNTTDTSVIIDLTNATQASLYYIRHDGALTTLTFNTPTGWNGTQANFYVYLRNGSTHNVNVYHTINSSGSTLINSGVATLPNSVIFNVNTNQINAPEMYVYWNGSNLLML
jgi:hypothetical protein